LVVNNSIKNQQQEICIFMVFHCSRAIYPTSLCKLLYNAREPNTEVNLNGSKMVLL